MLKQWDEATRAQRKSYLQAFVAQYGGATSGPLDLEHALGTTTTLYLSRILSWLRLGCTDGFGLTQHLQALQIFLHANHSLLQDFIDMDGADCVQVIALLQHIGRAGRTYKEYISSCDAERSVIQSCIARGHATCETPVWLACRSFLIEQSTGNPASMATTYAALEFLIDQPTDSVKCLGSQILRELISKKSPYFDARFCKLQLDHSIAVSMALLHHINYRVQYEALELIHIILENPSLHVPLCTAMLDWFRRCAVVKSALHSQRRDGSVIVSRREHNVPKDAEELVEVECFVHLKSPVLRLCRCFDSIIFECPCIADIAIQLGAMDILVYVILAANEGSLKWHAAWFTLLLMTARAVDKDPYATLAAICARECDEVHAALVEKAADIMSPADEHEFSECMEALMGDGLHQKKIWRYLHRLGWPILRHDGNDEAGAHDAELKAIEVQVEEAIGNVANDPMFDDDVLDATPTLLHDDHFYVQKLHEHFQHYRLPKRLI
ncbi:hypothetical protein SPRG_06307 [Saprolegnia parasitica CBS 223.65]|uniref:Uncharacterized protein n=1 Tax=Saprolegnia parasitica (strain CBS 223.65) TaxID=695850 RepID=A0A067CN85_SAPPC|nr:hypothetical protein SPRG_06307 [Saprolegnia parasitica CBS 223.65]KDO28257.1 hypothetical protein SPRG_06307 [Saprolegnia parasitica CBS 223.65]|eukprot:XP_012201079.1 hypothetical protein SPRG_06307 [Saprolegnia parasitica CBS 223.65]